MISPMLAVALDIKDVDRKAVDYLMQPKLDGIRCLASWDGRMYSRSAKTELHTRVPHIAQQVRELCLPQGVWIDGELGYLQSIHNDWPILDFNATVRVTGSLPGEALRKQREREDIMVFWVFDLIQEDAGSDSQVERLEMLQVYVAETHSEGDASDIVALPLASDWDKFLYESYVLAGGEGVILKNPKSPYIPGKRPARCWYKVKKFDSFDGKIVDYDYGLGKYTGQVGALVVEHPTGIHVRCSGMTDTDRLDMTENFWDKYRGKMCEVKFFGKVGVDATGIRHPQFLRMRPDLD